MKFLGFSDLILKNIKRDRYAKFLELMPNFKKEKAQKYTTIILTLSASIILGIFAVSPTLSTIVKLQKQLDDDKFVEQKLQEKINNLSILQQKYSALEDDLPIVYDAIPKSSQIPLLLAQLQGLANESNVKIVNFQTFPIGVSKDNILNKRFSSFDYNIVIQGDYQSMIGLLDRLVDFQRILTINNISIGKSSGNTQSLQLSVKGSAYFKD